MTSDIGPVGLDLLVIRPPVYLRRRREDDRLKGTQKTEYGGFVFF